MSNKNQSYIKRTDVERIVEMFDISSNTAGEASFESFLMWRTIYDLQNDDNINKFDIQSQVSMFDTDLRSLYN